MNGAVSARARRRSISVSSSVLRPRSRRSSSSRDGGLMNNHRFSDDMVRGVYDACVEAELDGVRVVGYIHDESDSIEQDFPEVALRLVGMEEGVKVYAGGIKK